MLASVEVVEPPEKPSKHVNFGATVILEAPDGTTTTHTIVGVDELSFEADAVSWISALGRALLAAKLGDRISMGNNGFARVVRVENR